MEMVGEAMVREDASIKGIWCVPLHSNPQEYATTGWWTAWRLWRRLPRISGYSGDNATGCTIFTRKCPLKISWRHVRPAAIQTGLTISFNLQDNISGAGISLIASGPDNMKEFKGHMSSETIGHDKLNQLRHVQYFKTPEIIRAHMADLLRLKLDMVLNRLEEELEGSGLAVWSRPKGGYFISLDTLAGCTESVPYSGQWGPGVTLSQAQAPTYPTRDPQDRTIRANHTCPTPEELKSAMDIFILCVKIAGNRVSGESGEPSIGIL